MLQRSGGRRPPQVLPLDERGRGPHDSGPDAAVEVAANPSGNGAGPPIALEALEVQVEAPHPLPQVRVIDPGVVAIDGIHELPKGPLALEGDGFGGRVERGRPRVLAGHGKVPEDDAERSGRDPRPTRGTVGAAEIEVDD